MRERVKDTTSRQVESLSELVVVAAVFFVLFLVALVLAVLP